ncbi:serine hydrolase [Brevibacillus choshinensis]|uniref:Serine hydrolase n=1 Tax=Brevibacillus choshinensis TaxID=54911 RepID=A0ABR5NAB6_BRECH|nr:serine hydrolase [Brevibacillus choshinensis]KQL48497.1 serine hydrolase [Brevibacillus choshinensis]
MNGIELMVRMEQSLEDGIRKGIFPGAAVSVMRKGAPTLTTVKGKTGVTEGAAAVDAQTLYDLASLTKVIVTLPLVLLSIQAGKLSLSDALITHIPEMGEGEDTERKAQIKIAHLLTHSSGLPAWRPFFLMGQGRAEYIRLISQEELIGTPGSQVVYSDLGFMVLGFLLERVWGEELDALAKRLIFKPSGMESACYLPLQQSMLEISGIAFTENGNAFEQNMAENFLAEMEPFDHPSVAEWREKLADYKWRQGVICGTVHDCNAHYGLGGISSHAGLFATVRDVERYMEIWTSDDAPVRIDPVLRALSTRSHTDPSIHRRGLGWIASSTGGSLEQVAAGCTGGDLVSEHAFGHTGFTGTSIWSDPVREATIITLTNRVHPVASPLIGPWRIAHHNQILNGIKPVGSSRERGSIHDSYANDR